LTYTKTKIVDKVAEKLNLPPEEAKDNLETLIEIMKGTLSSGGNLLISNFGKFCIQDKAPRKGRNPATGETIILKKRRIVTFSCSGKLRDEVNNNIPN